MSSMSHHDRTYKAYYDYTQDRYCTAIGQGVVEPVIVLRRSNTLVPNQPAPFMIAVFSRADAVRILSVADRGGLPPIEPVARSTSAFPGLRVSW